MKVYHNIMILLQHCAMAAREDLTQNGIANGIIIYSCTTSREDSDRISVSIEVRKKSQKIDREINYVDINGTN